MRCHMKRRSRYLGIILLITSLIMLPWFQMEADATQTSASDFQTRGTELVKYKGTSADVSVPVGIDVIGKKAFENNDKLKSISMPKSVKVVEAYAFWGCDNLKKVSLGSGLKEVGDYSFANCKGLSEITIPDNIRSIGIQAFADCTNLKVIKIPPEVTAIHETAFDGCVRLIIDCEEGSYADKYAKEFYKRQAEMKDYQDGSGDVPDNDSEKDEPDKEDEAPGLLIPVTPSSDDLLGVSQVVGNSAFIIMDADGNNVMDGDKIEANIVQNAGLHFQGVVTEQYPKYTIVDGKIVADRAYYKSEKVSVAELPAGITQIGQFSFARSSLRKITFPEGLQSVGYGAFYGCKDLTSVKLPESVHTIEPYAFMGTGYYDNFVKKGKTDFLISGKCLIAYKGDSLKVIVPDGVEVIAAEAFKGHSEIKKVDLPESLRVVGEGAFEDCTSLAKVVFGGKETEIHDRAFKNTVLKNVIVPETVERMGLCVFSDKTVVKYEGHVPAGIHASSAERLENAEYRGLANQTSCRLQVQGAAGIRALIRDAKSDLQLYITKEDISERFRKVFAGLSKEEEADKIIATYGMRLTDASDIPITKLGNNLMTVIVPIPKEYSGRVLNVAGMDANGQIEVWPCDRVRMEGASCVRFVTNQVSDFAVLVTSASFEGDEMILEANVSLERMAAPPLDDPFADLRAEDNGLNDDFEKPVINSNTYLYAICALILLIAASLLTLRRIRR